MHMTERGNKITILINPKLYSLEALYGAAYVFLDKAYIYLEEGAGAKIRVSLKGKEKLTKNKLKALRGEFLNELLNFSLRDKVSKNNIRIREYIVARALASASYRDFLQEEKAGVSEKDVSNIVIPWRDKQQKRRPEKETVWKLDSQGIVIPQEEKYLTKKRCRKEKKE